MKGMRRKYWIEMAFSKIQHHSIIKIQQIRDKGDIAQQCWHS